MPFEQNDMSGAIFRNKEKRNDRSPNMTGQALIDGVEYWVSAWTKTPRNGGDRFISLAFTRKEEQRGDAWTRDQGETEGPDFDEDIPF